MMACSYLSAGGLKSEPTSAACWSPPAMSGYHAAQSAPMTLPTLPMTLPTPSMVLPRGPMNLPSGSIRLHETMGLPRAPMTLPTSSMALPSGTTNLQTEPIRHEAMVSPRVPMVLPSGSTTLPSSQIGLSSGTVGIPNQPMGLPTGMPVGTPNPVRLAPPFAQPLPLDLHKTVSQTCPSASEPALDLSTSASPMTPSLKSLLPASDKDAE